MKASPIPAREKYPRDQHENFYWLQEDYIREKSAADGWAFSIWRPQLIVGPNYGVVMNLPPIIGAYAAIRKAEGKPFSFPGGVNYVWEAVDTRLVADALAWGATAPAAAGETFNLTNGEVFNWRQIWPGMAEVLGVEVGPDEPQSLAQLLPAKADVWDKVISNHGLRNVPMSELVGESVTIDADSWRFLTAIDGRRNLHALARKLGLSRFEARRNGASPPLDSVQRDQVALSSSSSIILRCALCKMPLISDEALLVDARGALCPGCTGAIEAALAERNTSEE